MQVLNEQTITIDLRRTVTIPIPRYRQYDTNILNIIVKDNKEDADLSNVSLITANYLRPDGEVVSRTLPKLGNVIEYHIKLEESQVFGEGELSIHIYEVDKRLSTKRIKIVMDESLEPSIEGTEDLTLLQELFQQVSTTLSDIQTSSQEITEAEALRVTAEEMRTEAEGLRQTSETNRSEAESHRVSAESSRVTAENERIANESTRVDSETGRQTAETNRVQAEEERQTNTSTAIQNAENATTDAIEATESINLVLPNILNLEYIAPYNATTQYLKNNIVRKDKNSYIALQPSLGNEPTGNTDSPFWGVIAIGGVDGTGTGTVTSVNGIEPVDGNVTLVIPDPDLSGLATKEELQDVEDAMIKSTTHDLTFYVNVTTGNDANDGLTSGTAFKTIQKAVNSIPNNILHPVKVNIAAGTYNETVEIYNRKGSKSVEIIGGANKTEAANYIITGGISIMNSSNINLIGLKVTGSKNLAGDGFIAISSTLSANIRGCIIDGASKSLSNERGIQCFDSTVYITLSDISNMGEYAIYVSLNSTLVSNTNTGTNNSNVLGAIGSTIYKEGEQPSGTINNVEVFGGIITDNIAKKTQEPWKTAVLQNGWTGTIKYRKNDLGQVFLQFSAMGGTIGTGTIIASLPIGYRAYANKISLYNSTSGVFAGDLVIDSLGGIKVVSGGLVQGVTYYAEIIYQGN